MSRFIEQRLYTFRRNSSRAYVYFSGLEYSSYFWVGTATGIYTSLNNGLQRHWPEIQFLI